MHARSMARCFLGSAALSSLIIVFALTPALAQAPAQFDKTFRQMLEAVQTNSYDQFMAQSDPWFKAGFTKKMFDELSQRLGPRLRQGYTADFLTTMNQQGYVVYVWKLSFMDKKDDFLATLFVKNGNVSGFVAR